MLCGPFSYGIAVLVVQFVFRKVVLLEGFTLNPTDEGYAIDATSFAPISARV